MSRTIKVAAIQMDAAPAPTSQRLERAGRLVAEAALAGAQVAVLPELFNTGYQYHDDNYKLAEPMGGQTATWLRQTAAQNSLHLAGTFMLREGDEIYNTALLFAPDGRCWRYNKRHPWAMERAYFRGDDNFTVAETDLGRFGMMICWDSAHPDVWAAYGGKVDAMLMLSCPPKMSVADIVFPDGQRVNMRDLNPLFKNIIATDEEFFPGVDADTQTAWLRVPLVATVGAGQIDTPLATPLFSVGVYVMARPDLWKWLRQAGKVRLQTKFDRQTKIVNAEGQVISRVMEDGDGFTVAEITLTGTPPQPSGAQPKMKTPGFVYWLSDQFAPMIAAFQYRRRKGRG